MSRFFPSPSRSVCLLVRQLSCPAENDSFDTARTGHCTMNPGHGHSSPGVGGGVGADWQNEGEVLSEL